MGLSRSWSEVLENLQWHVVVKHPKAKLPIDEVDAVEAERPRERRLERGRHHLTE